MLSADMILATLLWPAITVALVLSLLWIPAVHKSRNAALLVSATALAVGFIVGYWGIVGAPAWPLAIDAKARLPFIAGMALVATGLSMRWQSGIAALATTFVLALAAERLLLVAAIEFQWTLAQALTRVIALAIGMGILLVSTTQLQRQLPAKLSIFLIAAVSGLAAPLMVFSDSLVLAQLHGALGVSAGLLCLATWIFPTRVLSGQVHMVAMASAWSLWTISLLFANMPSLSFALLGSALPLGVLVLFLTKRSSPRIRHSLVVVITIAAIVVAVAIGGLRYKKTSEASADDDYGYGYDY